MDGMDLRAVWPAASRRRDLANFVAGFRELGDGRPGRP